MFIMDIMDKEKPAVVQRNSYDLKFKTEVINQLKNGKTQYEAAKIYGISRDTVKTIWRNRSKTEGAFTTGNTSTKRLKTSKYDDLDKQIFEWHRDMKGKGEELTGSLIKSKALMIAATLGIEGFTASNGWLEGWKNRYESAGLIKKGREKLCLFCSAQIKDEDLRTKDCSTLKTYEYWPYLQKIFLSFLEEEPTFTSPPLMCPTCFEKVEQIAKCHRKILELQEKLDKMRTRLDNAVKDVGETIRRSRSKDEYVLPTNNPEAISSTQSSEISSKKRSSRSGAKRSYDEMMESSQSETEHDVNVKEEVISEEEDEDSNSMFDDFNSSPLPSTSSSTRSSTRNGGAGFKTEIERKREGSSDEADDDSDFNLDESDIAEDSESESEYEVTLEPKRQKVKKLGLDPLKKRQRSTSASKKVRKSAPANSNSIRRCELCGLDLPKSTDVLHEHIVSHVGDYAFQCPSETCRQTFSSRYTAKTHRSGKRYCERVPSKVCDVCGEKCENLRMLGIHFQRHETLEKNFTCPIENCGEQFTIRPSVEYHLKTHLFRKNVQVCTVCVIPDRKRRTPSEMEAHLKDMHGATDILTCDDCPFIFHTDETLAAHKSSHTRSDNGVKCHLCLNTSEFFRSGKTLRQHYLKEHQIGKEYVCEQCDYSSLCLETLKHHISRVHGKKERLFPCDLCDDKPKFKTYILLKTHQRTMHGDEPYKCKFCDKCFNKKQLRNSHEKFDHLGAVRHKFPCPHCHLTFKVKSLLEKHIDIHSSEKKYECTEPGCEERFKTKPSLQRHVRYDHKGVAFVCETCGRSFKFKRILENHMRIHTGERPFLCKLCGMSFMHSASLFNHSKGHERKGDRFAPKGTFQRTSNRT